MAASTTASGRVRRSPPARFAVLAGLAFRNLRRELRRTLLAASAMVLGGGILIFSFALGDGSQEQWIRSGVRMGAGHVTVERPGFRASRSVDDRLPAEVRRAARAVVATPEIARHVVAVSARLTVKGLASSASGARPVRIVAVEPLAEAAFSTLDDRPVEGRYLEPGDRLHAYVGSGLASGLDLRLGSRLVVRSQDVRGEIAGQLLRVVGMFRSGVPEVDRSTIHVPLATAGEWLGTRQDVTSLGVVLNDSTVVADVAARLERELERPVNEGRVRVLDWRDANPALATAVAIDDFGNIVTQLLIFAVIAFGITNSVLASVLHRHREFGVLQSLGFTPGETGAVVLTEGLALTVVSGCIGVGAGLAGTWYFFGDGLDLTAMVGDMTFSGVAVDPVVRPQFRLSRVFESLAFICLVGTLASIYPALRAARIDVATVLKLDG